jgi:hypothetical protein
MLCYSDWGDDPIEANPTLLDIPKSSNRRSPALFETAAERPDLPHTCRLQYPLGGFSRVG